MPSGLDSGPRGVGGVGSGPGVGPGRRGRGRALGVQGWHPGEGGAPAVWSASRPRLGPLRVRTDGPASQRRLCLPPPTGTPGVLNKLSVEPGAGQRAWPSGWARQAWPLAVGPLAVVTLQRLLRPSRPV